MDYNMMKRTLILLALIVLPSTMLAQKASELKYVDAEKLMLINQGYDNTELHYSRLPEDMKSSTRKAVWDLGLNSAGLAIRFSTDSKVIGFRYTREQALDAFKNWCKGRKFVPSDFKSSQQLEKMTGLYVPFWVADCDVDAHYQAVGKKVKSWTSGEYHYTETSEYNIT